jgi:hypothetical protein
LVHPTTFPPDTLDTVMSFEDTRIPSTIASFPATGLMLNVIELPLDGLDQYGLASPTCEIAEPTTVVGCDVTLAHPRLVQAVTTATMVWFRSED